MKHEEKVLVGTGKLVEEPWEPFCEPVLEFLNQLSVIIRRDQGTSAYQRKETKAFGFWCRRTHMEEFNKRYQENKTRLGRGIIFHIPASNVPVLFAYSLTMGLLAGNSCAARISSRGEKQDWELCKKIDSLLKEPEHEKLRERIFVFTCKKEQDVVQRWIKQCDGCVLWGGDRTIMSLRSMPMKPDAVQMVFPDRYSICILDTRCLRDIQPEVLEDLAHRFYNDSYAMDQNACSSPRFVLWNQKGETEADRNTRRIWWEAVVRAAAGYEINNHKATAKYEALCRFAMESDDDIQIERYNNLLYTIMLKKIPANPLEVMGNCGMFFQYVGEWKDFMSPLALRQLQTVTYYGVRGKDLIDYVLKNHLQGVNRVVPVGKAVDMDPIWDGQDFITMLSRQISWED
ncbi:acyl-CoA reductase [Clostridium sp. E02]|uniref:acyl-CoA reductase n=1 Tax=Clostridium sp. E02 TaxID=2487134 RepID=UPI001FAA09A4|nr:acyl-CoA reductase [Clostridium sp. E02]